MASFEVGDSPPETGVVGLSDAGKEAAEALARAYDSGITDEERITRVRVMRDEAITTLEVSDQLAKGTGGEVKESFLTLHYNLKETLRAFNGVLGALS